MKKIIKSSNVGMLERIRQLHGLYTINVIAKGGKRIFGGEAWWDEHVAFDTKEEAVELAKREFMSASSDAELITITKWEAKLFNFESKSVVGFFRNTITKEWEEY